MHDFTFTRITRDALTPSPVVWSTIEVKRVSFFLNVSGLACSSRGCCKMWGLRKRFDKAWWISTVVCTSGSFPQIGARCTRLGSQEDRRETKRTHKRFVELSEQMLDSDKPQQITTEWVASSDRIGHGNIQTLSRCCLPAVQLVTAFSTRPTIHAQLQSFRRR